MPSDLSKTSPQEIAFLADFLNNFDLGKDSEARAQTAGVNNPSKSNLGHRQLEIVGQYLRKAPLSHRPDRSDNAWLAFLDANPEIKEECRDVIIDPGSGDASLVQEEFHLAVAIYKVFTTMAVEITDKCQVLAHVKVEPTPGSSLRLSQMSMAEEGCVGPVRKGRVMGAIAETYKDGKEGTSILIYQVGTTGGAYSDTLAAMKLTVGGGEDVALSDFRFFGMQFYDEEVLSVFLGLSNDDTDRVEEEAAGEDGARASRKSKRKRPNQRLVQLPLSQLDSCLESVAKDGAFGVVTLDASAPTPPAINSRGIFELADHVSRIFEGDIFIALRFCITVLYSLIHRAANETWSR